MFGSKSGNEGSSSSTTIITQCMNIEGNVRGCGTVHIDGIVNGDVEVDDTVIIGTSGKVQGTLTANKALISGSLDGNLICDSLEVTKGGVVASDIQAKTIVSDGNLEATINAEQSIHIMENGKVTTAKMKSKLIHVSGFVSGNIIASELLEVNTKGQTKGEMVVKKIKVAEGGLVLGTMLTYEESNSVRKVNVNAETYDEDKQEEA